MSKPNPIEDFCSFCDHFDPDNNDCQWKPGMARENQTLKLCTHANIGGHKVEMHPTTIETENYRGDDVTIHKCHYRGNRGGLIRRLEKGY